MADAILMAGGTGGITSDDVTAGKAQVLQGYKTVTTDSDDEIVEGTIPNRGNVVDTVSFENAHWESKFVARMEEGYYSQAGQWKPCVAIPYAVLANVAGIDANKMLDTLTAAGVRGTIPVRGYRGPDCTEMFMYQPDGGYVVRIEEGYYHMGGNRQWKPYVLVSPALAKSAVNYHPEKTLSDTRTCEEQGQIKMVNTQDSNFRINKSTAFGIDNWSDRSNPILYVDLPHGNGYYHRADGHPHTCIDATNLGTAGADSVLQWQTATSQHGINFQGTIPRWICNTGDVITALNGEGFVWDDTHANRGRGIVTKIPNGHFIQGANWVFLPSPNLQPWNVRKGVNINGVTGTMEDPNVGRVPFRNATFDNVLISGVANIGLGKNLNNYSVPSTEIRDGIIRFDTRWVGLHWYAPESTLNESITLAHSVNLSPFKTVRLGIKFPYGGNWGAVNSMGDLVGVVWALSTNHYAEYNPYVKIKVNPNMVKKTGTSRVIPQVSSSSILDKKGLDIPTGAEYFVDVDVSDLQGHHRIVLGFAVINPSGDKVTSRTIVRATNDIFGISHIEFIN